MKLQLLLLSLTALSSALPALQRGPVISDDDNLTDRHNAPAPAPAAEAVQPRPPHSCHSLMAKATRIASEARGTLREIFKAVVVDSKGRIMAIAYGEKITTIQPMNQGNHHHGQHHSHINHHHNHHRHRHHISLFGLRDRIAIFALAFTLGLAVALSYLKRFYTRSSCDEESYAISHDPSFSEKPLYRDIAQAETEKS